MKPGCRLIQPSLALHRIVGFDCCKACLLLLSQHRQIPLVSIGDDSTCNFQLVSWLCFFVQIVATVLLGSWNNINRTFRNSSAFIYSIWWSFPIDDIKLRYVPFLVLVNIHGWIQLLPFHQFGLHREFQLQLSCAKVQSPPWEKDENLAVNVQLWYSYIF